MISRTGIHAITALAYLVKLPNGQYVGASELAEQIGAPPNYLGKLLKTLADVGLLESQKGRGGGFRLAHDPAAVSLFEALDPIEHLTRWSGCFLGRPNCSTTHSCAVHHRWKGVRDVYLQFLRETTIGDLTEEDEPASNLPTPVAP